MEYVVIGASFVIVAAIAFIAGVVAGAKGATKQTIDTLSKDYHILKK